MSRKVVWRPQALEEFEDALAWYDARSIFAAQRLADGFRARLVQIMENPARFSFSRQGCRWAQVAKFPYQLHYWEAAGEIVILAFWHEKRDREVLTQRLIEG